MKTFSLNLLFITAISSLLLLFFPYFNIDKYAIALINSLCLLFFVFLNLKHIILAARARPRVSLLVLNFCFFSLLYLIWFTLLTYGSPFIYEDQVDFEKKMQTTQITTSGQYIEYQSALNHLGSVELFFLPQSNQGLEADLATTERAKVIFSIAESGEEPFFVNVYDLSWSGPDPVVYPFGFPPQEDSKDKTYFIFVAAIEEDSSSLLSIGKRNGEVLVKGRYVFSKHEIKENVANIIDVLTAKSLGAIRNQLAYFLPLFLIFLVILTHSLSEKTPFNRILHRLFLSSWIMLLCIQILALLFPSSDFQFSYFYLILTSIIFSALLFWKRKSLIDYSVLSLKNNNFKYNLKPGLWIFLALGIIAGTLSFWLMTYDLGKFMTVDEPRWVNYFNDAIIVPQDLNQAQSSSFIGASYARSVVYWDSYLSGNIKGTIVSGGNGITTNILHFPAYFFQESPLERYLYISRVSFVFHNLFLLGVASYLLTRLTTARQGLFFFIATALFPLFVGFSRIVNHDSINGLYILLFVLTQLIGIRTLKIRYFVFSGIFYTLSLLTSFKGSFVIPLLFLLPFISFAISGKDESLNSRYLLGLKAFFITAASVFFLMLPSAILFPKIIFTKLFMPRGIVGIATTLSILSFYSFYFFQYQMQKSIIGVLKFSPLLVRSFIISLTLLIIGSLGTAYLSLTQMPELLMLIVQSINKALASVPIPLLIIFGIWAVFYFRKPQIDLSVISMALFWVFICLAVFVSTEYGAGDAKGLTGKYLMVVIYFFLLALATAEFFKKLSYPKISALSLLMLISLFYSNFKIAPHYDGFSSFYFGERTIHSLVTGEYYAAEYINKNLGDVTIYDQFSRINNFLNQDKRLLWWTEWPSQHAEYIVIYNRPSISWYEKYGEIWHNGEAVWEYWVDGVRMAAIFKGNIYEY